MKTTITWVDTNESLPRHEGYYLVAAYHEYRNEYVTVQLKWHKHQQFGKFRWSSRGHITGKKVRAWAIPPAPPQYLQDELGTQHGCT